MKYLILGCAVLVPFFLLVNSCTKGSREQASFIREECPIVELYVQTKYGFKRAHDCRGLSK